VQLKSNPLQKQFQNAVSATQADPVIADNCHKALLQKIEALEKTVSLRYPQTLIKPSEIQQPSSQHQSPELGTELLHWLG